MALVPFYRFRERWRAYARQVLLLWAVITIIGVVGFADNSGDNDLLEEWALVATVAFPFAILLRILIGFARFIGPASWRDAATLRQETHFFLADVQQQYREHQAAANILLFVIGAVLVLIVSIAALIA